MDSRLSVESMTKVEMPSASTGMMIFPSSFMSSLRILRMVLGPVRKRMTQMAPTAWLSTVAMAAPFTPMPSPKMNSGSSAMFNRPPVTRPIMAKLALPS